MRPMAGSRKGGNVDQATAVQARAGRGNCGMPQGMSRRPSEVEWSTRFALGALLGAPALRLRRSPLQSLTRGVVFGGGVGGVVVGGGRGWWVGGIRGVGRGG